MRYILLATRIRNASMLAILRFAWFGSVPDGLAYLTSVTTAPRSLAFVKAFVFPLRDIRIITRATESGTLQVLRCCLEATKRTAPTGPSTLECFRYRNPPRHELSNGPNPGVLLSTLIIWENRGLYWTYRYMSYNYIKRSTTRRRSADFFTS